MNAKRESSSSSHGAKEEKDAERSSREEMQVDNKDDGNSSKTSSPQHNKPEICNEEDELQSVKNEMDEVKQENERLKKTLERIENDYRCLEMRFLDILQQERLTKSEDASPSTETKKEEEHEISLSLGLQTTVKPKKYGDNTGTYDKAKEDTRMMSEELSLGLDFKCSSKPDLSETGSDKSSEVGNAKEDEIGDTWPPSKVLKTARSSEKDEEVPQPNAKRARVCVRARCDTPTMNDGCQWRKYGQKIAKGNPCPRGYYRCTVAPSCPVRKQVQRCSDDMSILITTYEGTHNHQLPVAATAMASTTSAAASMLMSGSSTSQALNSSAPTTTANLNGFNFTLYNNSSTGQFNLPSSSAPTPPTITLDLTSNQNSQFSRTHTNNFISQPKYTSRSLDFSSTEANTFPTAWNNYLSYSSLPSNKNPIGSLTFGNPSQQQFSHPYLERTTPASSSSTSSSQQYLTETLTKVLTSDPTFQSAVAAAISSMVGSSNKNVPTINRVSAENVAPPLKWGDSIHSMSVNSLPPNSKACATTYLNKPQQSSSTSQAAGSFVLLQPQFPFSLSKSSSSSDLRDQLK